MLEDEKVLIRKSAKLCSEYIRLEQQVADYRQQIQTPVISRQQFRANTYRPKRIFMFILCVIICNIILTKIKMNNLSRNNPLAGAISIKSVSTNLIPVSLILCGVVLFTFNAIKFNITYKNAVETQKSNTAKAAENLRRILPEYQQLRKKVYDKSQCIIPNDYIYAAEYINSLIVNKRADSLKEALNIYEQDLHNQRMREDLHEQTRSFQNHLNDLEYELSWQARQTRESIDDLKR